MQNPLTPQFDVFRYLRLLWKRKWIVLAPTAVFPLVAGYHAMQLPDRFKSETLILVQAQKVPTQFVASTVTTGIGDRLHTISQQIFSRTRLEQIIQEFNLFQREKETKTPEEIINLMRSRIDLVVHRSDAFRLSYIDSNPRLAMLVTNKLASLFIEENLKVREQQAIGTTQFLGDEIDRYRELVRERETVIYEFRRAHMDELPEQSASNQSRVAQLQSQLQINAQDINAAEGRRVQLQQQLAEIERRAEEQAESSRHGRTSGQSISDLLVAQFSARTGSATGVDEGALRQLEDEIARREQVIEGLLLTYTEKHPDVQRVKAEIAKLQEKVDAERARNEAERSRLAEEQEAGGEEETLAADTPPREEAQPVFPPIYERLKADLLRTEAGIARLQAQNGELQRSIEMYQARLAATPARQLQLQQLSEDYDNLKAVLEGLINKKLQADMSENLERKQKGEQFKILDPANLPEKPYYPNRLRYVGGGLVLGLALGLGFTLLLDLLDLSVKTRQELVATVDVPVLGMIPIIQTPADIRRRWVWRLGASGVAAVCLVVAAAVIHLGFKPLPRVVADLRAQVGATHWTTVK